MSGTHLRKDRSKTGRFNDKDKYQMDGTKKDCFYDSGRTDSGILSGGNLVSDICSSGEISPPPERSDDRSMGGGKTDSYKRLDSGVDVGLSDQLSGLDIEEKLDDFVCTDRNFKPCSGIPTVQIPKADRLPWEQYFARDDEGDT